MGVFVLNSNDVSTPLQSLSELPGWVEENGTCISFWLSRANTSCLRSHFEFRLTPLHLILLPLKLMWGCLSRKADSKTGNLGGYIQLKKVQYRVFPCSGMKHCKRDLPYYSAADLRERLMLFSKSAKAAHSALWPEEQQDCCKCSVIAWMVFSSGKFHHHQPCQKTPWRRR